MPRNSRGTRSEDEKDTSQRKCHICGVPRKRAHMKEANEVLGFKPRYVPVIEDSNGGRKSIWETKEETIIMRHDQYTGELNGPLDEITRRLSMILNRAKGYLRD